MKRLFGVLVASLLVVGLLAGCAGQAKLTEVAIASISPLSGGQASLGVAIKNGVELALKDREKDLTAAGYKVVYKPQDDEAKPEVGSQVAQRVAADRSVIAVVGTLNSGVARAIIPVFAREGGGLVMVSPANTNPVLTQGNPHYNRIVFKDDFQGPAGARYAAKVLGIKTVYVMHDKTEYGKGLADEFAKEIVKHGVTVIANIGVDQGKADYGPEATQATARAADMVYFGGIYDTAGPLFKQIRAKGFRGMFMGGDGLDSSDLIKLGGDAVENTYFTSVSADYKSGEGKAFFDKYKAAYKDDPPTYAVYGYDAANLVLDRLIEYGKANKGKVPTRPEFSQIIRNTKNFKGITSTVTFDANGDNPTSAVFVFQVQDGKFSDKGMAPQN
jgi:branched-chain amino acid transport system substrate-binding protein